MNYWLTTDTHFGHGRIIEFCGRPENFNEKIIRGLQVNVKPEDIIIHLGDVVFNNGDIYLKQFSDIPCKSKILLQGNHDKRSSNWYLDHGFNFVARHIGFEMFGKMILFSHIPEMDLNNVDVNIHGHFHNTEHRRHEPELNVGSKHILIALEYTNYQPCNLLDVLNKSKNGIYKRS